MEEAKLKEKNIIELRFKPHDGLLTHLKVYWKDVPQLIKAIQRAAYMEPEEDIRERMKDIKNLLKELNQV